MNHRAQRLADTWPSRRGFVPQGCDQQGRQSSTIPVVIDRVREDYDAEDQTESADGVFWVYMATIGAVIAAAAWAAFA